MWIEAVALADGVPRVRLLCDECGAIFVGKPAEDRRSRWREANIAGWARTGRAPERHVCAEC